jgi:hypothetical protein
MLLVWYAGLRCHARQLIGRLSAGVGLARALDLTSPYRLARVRAARPFYPLEQTPSACPSMSVWCQFRTHAAPQKCVAIR